MRSAAARTMAASFACSLSPCPTTTAAFAPSFLTWNTFFSPYRWAERMAGLLRTCEARQPSVVCLQEVLPQFLLQPGWDAWLERHGYVSSATDPEALAPYGVLTLASRDLRPLFEVVRLPTRMGRKLLVTHIETPCTMSITATTPAGPSERWLIGNVHLESLDSAALRAEQLAIAGQVLNTEADANAVLCGDFNFDSDRNYNLRGDLQLENDVLATALPGFHDVWPLLHHCQGNDSSSDSSSHKGYTFDATANPLIDRPRPDEQMRYDRVMARMARRSRWRPVEIQLVGTQPMDDGLYLSDHFGLLTTFAADKT